MLLVHQSANAVTSGFYSLVFKHCRQSTAPVAPVVVVKAPANLVGQLLGGLAGQIGLP